MNEIPTGRTKDEIKAREKLIKEFYAQWISEHPDKKLWNRDLGADPVLHHRSANT